MVIFKMIRIIFVSIIILMVLVIVKMNTALDSQQMDFETLELKLIDGFIFSQATQTFQCFSENTIESGSFFGCLSLFQVFFSRLQMRVFFQVEIYKKTGQSFSKNCLTKKF